MHTVMYGVHFYVMQMRPAAAPADSRRETDAAGGDEKGADLSTKIPGIAMLSFCHSLETQGKQMIEKMNSAIAGNGLMW